MFYLGLLGTLLFAIAVLVEGFINDGKFTLANYSGKQYLMCLSGCAFDTICMNSLVFAFQVSSSGFISLFTYLTIVYSLFADKFIFEQMVVAKELLAGGVIIVTSFIVSVYKIKFTRKKGQK